MYLQILEQIRQRVASGDWQPGDEIPSIRALAASTKVSVITVKRAYLELERAGVIVTRQGRGSFVADSPELGTELKEQELDRHLTGAAELADLLDIGDDELTTRLTEKRAGRRRVAVRPGERETHRGRRPRACGS
jgi:GntR family transcriptional regulator